MTIVTRTRTIPVGIIPVFPFDVFIWDSLEFLHVLIVALDRMDSLPAALWIVLASLEVAGATVLWPSHHFAAYMITAFPLGLEALIIASSRWSEKSPSPFGGPFLLFSLGHASAALIPPLITAPITIMLAVHVLIQFGLLWCMSYASLIETYRVELRLENENDFS